MLRGGRPGERPEGWAAQLGDQLLMESFELRLQVNQGANQDEGRQTACDSSKRLLDDQVLEWSDVGVESKKDLEELSR